MYTRPTQLHSITHKPSHTHSTHPSCPCTPPAPNLLTTAVVFWQLWCSTLIALTNTTESQQCHIITAHAMSPASVVAASRQPFTPTCTHKPCIFTQPVTCLTTSQHLWCLNKKQALQHSHYKPAVPRLQPTEFSSSWCGAGVTRPPLGLTVHSPGSFTALHHCSLLQSRHNQTPGPPCMHCSTPCPT